MTDAMTDAMKQRILSDMKTAMRSRDQFALSSIRLLRAAIQRQELDLRQTLDDKGVLLVIEKIIKQGKDAASQFAAGGRPDLEHKELAMVSLLQQYLPAQLTDDALQSVIFDVIQDTAATSLRDMGKVMAALKPKIAGKADITKVSLLVKSQLNPPLNHA